MMFCLWCVRSSPRKDQDNNPAACQLEEEDLCSNGGEQEVKPITQGISASSGLRKISATSLTKPSSETNAAGRGAGDGKAIVISEENSYFRRHRKKKMISYSVKQTSGKRRNNASPTSTSCPQLTVEEPTESNCSDEETEQNLKPSSASFKSSGVHTENKPKQQSSLITKTYSFRRMLSFRSSLRGGRSNGGRSHNSSFEDSTLGFSSASPGLQPHHRPLQFSFLGQIYKTKSTKQRSQASQQRRFSSQKLHVHPNENEQEIVRSENNVIETQAILEP